ncbi:MAG TPA: hypothetical protein VNJ12_10970 [Candidatus Dormibacteraeota bacterium]|nr:hypothetical protein [Candidatus Dormibacteraeota bacterium]
MLPQAQSYADCVKNSGNEASVQAALRYISGGRIGNGAFFSALLGNPISGIIQTVEDATTHSWWGAGSAAAGTGLGLAGGNVATAAAPYLPPVVVGVSASVSAQVDGPSGVAAISASFNAVVPIGQIASGALSVFGSALTKFGNLVTLPVSITASAFGAITCTVGP